MTDKNADRAYDIYRENFNGQKIREELIGRLPKRVIKQIHKILRVNEKAGKVYVSSFDTGIIEEANANNAAYRASIY